MRAALGLLLAVAACGGGGGDEPDAAVSASCMEATTHSDFAWIEANVLARGCGAFRSCHQGTAVEAGMLNLEAGRSYDALVGVPSVEHPDLLLVAAGKPDESYLLVALGGADGPLPSKGRMPLNNPPLCDEKIQAIRRWIEAGAAND
jgi:hypothetical protein